MISNLKHRFCYLFVLFCIFATDSMISISINTNTFFYYGFRWAAIALCPVFFILSVNIKHADRKWSIIIILVAICLFATALFNSDYAFAIPVKLAYFFLGYCAVKYFGADNIFEAFADLMVFVSLFSLICYVVSIFNINIFDFLPNITIVAAKSGRVSNFANAIFCIIPQNSWGAFPRNYGLFAEPGIYQVYLAFAMIAVLYCENKNKKIKLILLVVSMITTFSTTGYIVMLCLFLFYFTTSYNLGGGAKILAIAGTFVAIFVIVQNEFIFSNVFEKVQNTNDASTISRLYSFPINFLTWIRSPIFGVGPVKMNSFTESIAINMTKSEYFHNTNTYMYTLACFGLPLFAVEMIKGISLARKLAKGSTLRTLGLFVIIFICMSGENLTFSLCMEVLLFCGISIPSELYTEEEIYDIS